MNQFQIILLLLLTKSNIPKTIVNYLSGLKSTTWSFNFIPFKDIPGLSKMTSYLDFPLANNNLDYFGVSSGSAFVNNFSLIWVLIIICVFQIIFILIYQLLIRKIQLNKLVKWLQKVYQAFVFSIYIRIYFEVNTFLIISSASELNEWNTSSVSNILSLIIALIFYMISIGFIVLSYVFWIKHRNYESMNEQIPLKELFNGIKVKSSAKLYSTIFLWRRMIFASLLRIKFS